MKIEEIHLYRYKRFYDLRIDFGGDSKRIVALVGPNGCGKSSVFDGMLFLMNQFSNIGDFRSSERTYQYHSLEQNPSYNYQNVDIKFDSGMFQGVFNKKKENGLEHTIFSFRSSFRYNSNLDVKNTEAMSDIRNNDYGASYAGAIDQRIEQNYRRLKIKYDNYLEDEDCKPSEAKTHIIGELNDAIKNCLKLKIVDLGSIEAGKGTLHFSKDDTKLVFPFNVLSSGEKEVIDILLDLYLRKDEYTDSIYIIDEPELHLNTSIQRKLLIEINKMVPQNCQIWIATHSIGFLRALQEELGEESQIIRFDEENKWAEQPYTLKPIVKSRAAWLSIFSTALDDLTNLVSPKRIIYCEGRAEPASGGIEQGLDAHVYNNIFAEQYPDTLFVSSGGNTELDQRSNIAISILSKVFNNVEILVLKDRDMASGHNVSEESRQEYLRLNPVNHRVLKRFEIENYLYDKEVLIKYCINNNHNFDQKTYDEKISDLYNEDVKSLTGLIKNICGVTVPITAENFKIELSKVIEPTMSIYKELDEIIFKRQ